jgi:hypothetical protein
MKVLTKRGRKPSGWPPANRPRVGGPGGRAAARIACAEASSEGGPMGHHHTSPNHPRLVFDTEGIDWDDDASIDRWTEAAWQQAITTWGITVTTTPSVVLDATYAQAVAFASTVHADQSRKGTSIPYVTHLLGVSSLVLEAGGSQDEAIAGLLHDAVEDGDGLNTLTAIRQLFGDRVAEIVQLCSDSTDKEWKRRTPYWVRKQRYLDHLETTSDSRAVLVSIADKVHNARAIVTDLQRFGPDVLAKFNATPPQTLTYYLECLRIGEQHSVPEALLWPLHTAVLEIDQYVMGAGDGLPPSG